SSQWFLAPVMLFLVVLGIVYASDAGLPLQAAAVTPIRRCSTPGSWGCTWPPRCSAPGSARSSR
ncbi:MAG TPA: hypothetical protein VGD83_06210, partial [Streptosporangiaceae bacterium]